MSSKTPGSPRVLIPAQPCLCLEAQAPETPFHLAPGPRQGLDRSCRLACELAHLEISTRILGRLGDDAPGRHIRACLETTSVDLNWLQCLSEYGPTNLCLQSTPESRYAGAGATLDEKNLPLEVLDGVTHIHLDVSTLYDAPLRRMASQLKKSLRRESHRLSLHLDFRGGEAWPRYDAQTYLRTLLGPGSLLILDEPSLSKFFPSFWTREALFEGGHDMQAEEILLLARNGTFSTSTRQGVCSWDQQVSTVEAPLAQILAGWMRGSSLEEAVQKILEGPSDTPTTLPPISGT